MESDMSVEGADLAQPLLLALQEQTLRGLLESAKMLSELLQSLASTESCPLPCLSLSPAVWFGKVLFDSKEYFRAAFQIQQSNEAMQDSLGLFLWSFSLYLAQQQKDHEEQIKQQSVDQDEESSVSKGMTCGYTQVVDRFTRLYDAGQLDGYCCYVYALCLGAKKVSNAFVAPVLRNSIRLCPFNWSAWNTLAEIAAVDDSLVCGLDEGSFFFNFFMFELYLHRDALSEANEYLKIISRDFGCMDNIRLQYMSALRAYQARDHDVADSLFKSILSSDPYRTEGLDIYSNILFVQGEDAELSALAHELNEINKFSPETCCVVANYYSLQGQHDQAILYFQRALRLDSNYISAWVLLGQEYMEMRDPRTARLYYRKASQLNPRDYRAWHSLGQSYEFQDHLTHALHYYLKAVNLRPWDSRLWCAVGEVYLKLGKHTESIASFKKALGNNDVEGIAVEKLAKLYDTIGNLGLAEQYYTMILQRGLTDDPSCVEALQFLTKKYFQDGKTREAHELCQNLLALRMPASVQEEARLLLGHIQGSLT